MSDTIAGLAKLNNTRKARWVIADARDMLGGNGILLDNHVMRHMADIEAIHTFEGTETMQALIVGRDITGVGAFLVGLCPTFDRKLAASGEVGRIRPVEVRMRPPEVFVRPLAHAEATAFKSRAKKAKHFATRERAAILLASNVGNSVPQIAAMWMTDESHVRRVIHEFNERGMASLDPDYRGGRPRRITDEQRRQVVAVAGARPDDAGGAADTLVAARLADHLAEQGIVQISAAHLGRVLADAGLSFQRTRTWKASPDPDYEAKAARVLELRAAPPADGGAVIAFDQMGPISLRPMAGAGWAPRSGPSVSARPTTAATACATSSAPTTSTTTACASGCGPRRRGSDNLAFMTQIRAAIPARRRIYWIQDNLSAPTGRPTSARSPPAHKIELVPHTDLRQLPQPGRVPLLPDRRVRRQQRRLRRLGRASPGRWPATSATATAHTATNASASSKPVTRSPPDAVSGQTFREGPLGRVDLLTKDVRALRTELKGEPANRYTYQPTCGRRGHGARPRDFLGRQDR